MIKGIPFRELFLIVFSSVFLFQACTSGFEAEATIDISTEQLLINHAVNPSGEEFIKILEHARIVHEEKDGSFLDSFFETASNLYPELEISDLFRPVSSINGNSSKNDAVIAFFESERTILFDELEGELRHVLRNDAEIKSFKLNEDNASIVIELEVYSDEDQLRTKIEEANNRFQSFEIYQLETIMSALDKIHREVPYFDQDSSVSRLLDLMEFGGDSDAIIAQVSPRNNEKVMAILGSQKAIKLLPNDLVFKFDGQYKMYACRAPRDPRSRLISSHIETANASRDRETNSIVVNMEMTNEGAVAWQKMTANNVNEFIALAFDDVIITAPHVIAEISGGSTQITSVHMTMQEAEEIASQIEKGSLSLPCKMADFKKN